MCGFGGILNSKNILSRDVVFDTATRVNFRGPDSTGVILLDEKYCPADLAASSHALFFNRLAIVDLNNRSDQPFVDDRYILLFNGEIYNYKDLKKQLQTKGIYFKTVGDTEVLFEALKFWGIDAIKNLNGMFSFVFIDLLTKDVILARDRVGIKPMYYSVLGNTICFASECDSIVRLQKKGIEVDNEVLKTYLWLQYTSVPRTIHQSINKLPPGTFLRFNVENNRGDYQIQSYWDAYAHVQYKKEPDEESLEELLTESLGLQIHADVPVGLFLSSGVDSSLLAAIINNKFAKQDNNFSFFTVAFGQITESDESNVAKAFIKGFKNPALNHHFLEVSSEMIFEKANALYQVYDEPFADPAALLNWAISEKAREQVKVVLSGDGADELFWGYDRYNLWKLFDFKNKRFPFLSKVKGRIQQITRGHYNTIFTTDSFQLHYNLLKTNGLKGKNPLSCKEYWCNKGAKFLHLSEDLPALIDIKTYLPDAMLYKVDRSSMAASIEVRVPYLDNRVIEYALGLPFKSKSNNTYDSKAILKELLFHLAPHYKLDQPKKGFSMPLKDWLFTKWKNNVYEVLMNTPWTDYDIDKSMVKAILESFYMNRADTSRDIWHLYNFGLWLETKKRIL